MPLYEYVVVTVHPPGGDPLNFGVLLADRDRNLLLQRLRTDTDKLGLADEALEVLTPELFKSLAQELGAVGTLNYLMDVGSSTVRVHGPQSIEAASPEQALEDAFRSNVP